MADVLWPLAFGLAFGALTLWAGLTYSHNQAAFRAQALPATGVIDQIYASPPTVGLGGVASFDQYGVVRFEARGQFADARVLLGSCTGLCTPKYHVGQEVLVYYLQNLSYAQLGAPGHGAPLSFYGIWLFAVIAAILLFAAAVNAVTWLRGWRSGREPPRGRQSSGSPGHGPFMSRPLSFGMRLFSSKLVGKVGGIMSLPHGTL